MRFSKDCKIQRAAAASGHRYASMSEVLFEKDTRGSNPRLIATNGRGLAVIPVTDADGDDPGIIPSDAIAEAIKGRTNKKPDALISANGKVEVQTKSGATITFEREETVSFPDWEQVIPEGEPTLRIGINPKLLLQIAEAIGSGEGVVMEFRNTEVKYGKTSSTPIVIRPIEGLDVSNDGRMGVVMPMTIDAA